MGPVFIVYTLQLMHDIQLFNAIMVGHYTHVIATLNSTLQTKKLQEILVFRQLLEFLGEIATLFCGPPN